MNLKPFLDAANAAEARVAIVASQIDALFSDGKNSEATALRSELEKAQSDARAANELYISMRNATTPASDPARGIMSRVEVTRDEADQPFARPGDFFMAVKNSALYGTTDPRLRSRRIENATGMSEGVPADGGYLLEQQTAAGILENMWSTGQVLSRCSRDPVSGTSNSITYKAVDETSRVNGSRTGGVTAGWLGEGGTLSASKPKFREIDIRLRKAGALCYATDEQLQDTPNLESWLNRVVPRELVFTTEDAIFEGLGGGMPLGFINSPALIKVLRVDANKIQTADVTGMWARRYTGLSNYVWFINQDTLPQLLTMTLSNEIVYMPPGGLSASPYGSLFGRPVIEVEYAQTLGTTGDISLVDLSQYQVIEKGGVQAASSIHVAFLTDEMAFRFVYRVGGAPLWYSPVTPLHGSNTVSPFVTLNSASA